VPRSRDRRARGGQRQIFMIFMTPGAPPGPGAEHLRDRRLQGPATLQGCRRSPAWRS